MEEHRLVYGFPVPRRSKADEAIWRGFGRQDRHPHRGQIRSRAGRGYSPGSTALRTYRRGHSSGDPAAECPAASQVGPRRCWRPSSSVAEWQRSQIRNGTECWFAFGWWRATKAFTDSSLWMKPFASRKSSARYTVGGAAAPRPRRPRRTFAQLLRAGRRPLPACRHRRSSRARARGSGSGAGRARGRRLDRGHETGGVVDVVLQDRCRRAFAHGR